MDAARTLVCSGGMGATSGGRAGSSDGFRGGGVSVAATVVVVVVVCGAEDRIDPLALWVALETDAQGEHIAADLATALRPKHPPAPAPSPPQTLTLTLVPTHIHPLAPPPSALGRIATDQLVHLFPLRKLEHAACPRGKVHIRNRTRCDAGRPARHHRRVSHRRRSHLRS